MQQLSSLYRGDQSETLGSIMGGQYAPQSQLNNFTSNWTIAGVQGTGATQRAAMQIDAQRQMQRDQLRQQNKQFMLSDALANRTQDEAELNGMATRGYNAGMLNNSTTTTAWNTGGQAKVVQGEAENAAGGELASLTSQIDFMIAQLNPEDPDYETRKGALESRKQTISAGFESAQGPGAKAAYIKSAMGMLNPPKGTVGVAGTLALDHENAVYSKSVTKKPAPIAPGAPGFRPAGARPLGPGQLDPYRNGSVELTEHGKSLYPGANGFFPLTGETPTAIPSPSEGISFQPRISMGQPTPTQTLAGLIPNKSPVQAAGLQVTPPAQTQPAILPVAKPARFKPGQPIDLNEGL